MASFECKICPALRNYHKASYLQYSYSLLINSTRIGEIPTILVDLESLRDPKCCRSLRSLEKSYLLRQKDVSPLLRALACDFFALIHSSRFGNIQDTRSSKRFLKSWTRNVPHCCLSLQIELSQDFTHQNKKVDAEATNQCRCLHFNST